MTVSPAVNFLDRATRAVLSLALIADSFSRKPIATVPGNFVGAGVVAVTRNTGSLVKVNVTDPATVAVATSVRPEEVTRYIESPTWMLGSVIVMVTGELALGEAPSSVCHDAAKAMTSL